MILDVFFVFFFLAILGFIGVHFFVVSEILSVWAEIHSCFCDIANQT
jgi:hypothetical protein